MGIVITNKTIEDWLVSNNRPITLIGNYIRETTKIKFLCVNCGCEWDSTFKNIRHGKGCTRCAGFERYSNDVVDRRLLDENRTIKRIGEVKSSEYKTAFQCNICDYIWNAKPSNVLDGSGCPSCAKHVPLTDEIIDFRISTFGIKRLQNSKGASHKISWSCSNGHTWKAAPSVILSGAGCRKCYNISQTMTNDSLDSHLIGRGIKRVGDVVTARVKIEFVCLHDNYSWFAVPDSILRGTGCARCVNQEPITDEIIDLKLLNDKRNIIRLSKCKGANKNIEWKCTCGHIWSASPSNILKPEPTGCPKCNNKNDNELRILDKLIEYYTANKVKHQHSIKANNRRYDIDFLVNNIFIEYNGKQHYEPIEFFGGMESFIKQQQRDNEVRDYCSLNNIKLIEIPYYLSHEEQYKLISNLFDTPNKEWNLDNFFND